jgi:zinc protease
MNTPKVEASFMDELTKTLASGFTADEVAEAKKAIRDQRVVGRSQDAQLVRVMLTREEYGRTLDWDTQMDAKIAALTAEQISAAFRKHIDVSAISIVKAGDFKAAKVYQQ